MRFWIAVLSLASLSASLGAQEALVPTWSTELAQVGPVPQSTRRPVFDANGNAYFAGRIDRSFAVQKVTPSGELAWSLLVPPTANAAGDCRAVAISPNGDVWAVGTSYGSIGVMIDGEKGILRWMSMLRVGDRVISPSVATFDATGQPVAIGNSSTGTGLVRLDRTHGGIELFRDIPPAISFDKLSNGDCILVRSDRKLSRIRARDGATVWTQDLPQFVSPYEVRTTPGPAMRLLLQCAVDRQIDALMVDGSTGRHIYSRSFDTSTIPDLQDNAGTAFLDLDGSAYIGFQCRKSDRAWIRLAAVSPSGRELRWLRSFENYFDPTSYVEPRAPLFVTGGSDSIFLSTAVHVAGDVRMGVFRVTKSGIVSAAAAPSVRSVSNSSAAAFAFGDELLLRGLRSDPYAPAAAQWRFRQSDLGLIGHTWFPNRGETFLLPFLGVTARDGGLFLASVNRFGLHLAWVDSNGRTRWSRLQVQPPNSPFYFDPMQLVEGSNLAVFRPSNDGELSLFDRHNGALISSIHLDRAPTYFFGAEAIVPTADGDAVIFGTDTSQQGKGRYARISLATGACRWSYRANWVAGEHPVVSQLNDDYAAVRYGHSVAFVALRSGRFLWEASLPFGYALAASPNGVYACYGGELGERMRKLDLRSGSTVWDVPLPLGQTTYWPYQLVVHSDSVVFGAEDNGSPFFGGLDEKNGAILWQRGIPMDPLAIASVQLACRDGVADVFAGIAGGKVGLVQQFDPRTGFIRRQYATVESRSDHGAHFPRLTWLNDGSIAAWGEKPYEDYTTTTRVSVLRFAVK